MADKIDITIGYNERIEAKDRQDARKILVSAFNKIAHTLDDFGVENRELIAIAQVMSAAVKEEKFEILKETLATKGFDVRKARPVNPTCLLD